MNLFRPRWLSARQPVPRRWVGWLAAAGFALPLALWAAVSYIPGLWTPLVRIEEPAGVASYSVGALVDREDFARQVDAALRAGQPAPAGTPANPVFLPAPHEVLTAFYRAFTIPPRRSGEPWLHESLGHSISIIFWGFLASSLLGVPLGLVAGTYRWFRGLWEPFLEFFRYLPAPAFGALAIAVLGINDPPKIAIIFIGTFFQQVLVIANTTSKLDITLLEAARTLGRRGFGLFFKVIIPGVLPDVYRDQRILLGWAWTYLIVAEVVGTSTGITWFINQQARYRLYDNVFAAILMIGLIGLATDAGLAWLGKKLFPWRKDEDQAAEGAL